MGDLKTSIFMTTANLTVFPCVCQIETLGIKELITLQYTDLHLKVENLLEFFIVK